MVCGVAVGCWVNVAWGVNNVMIKIAIAAECRIVLILSWELISAKIIADGF
jgi:hypothetical protein